MCLFINVLIENYYTLFCYKAAGETSKYKANEFTMSISVQSMSVSCLIYHLCVRICLKAYIRVS